MSNGNGDVLGHGGSAREADLERNVDRLAAELSAAHGVIAALRAVERPRATGDARALRTSVEYVDALPDVVDSSYIAERDEEIAAWCIAKAEAAEREAAAHDLTADRLREQQNDVAARSHRERAMRYEGQAVAWRGTAALLRGLGK